MLDTTRRSFSFSASQLALWAAGVSLACIGLGFFVGQGAAPSARVPPSVQAGSQAKSADVLASAREPKLTEAPAAAAGRGSVSESPFGSGLASSPAPNGASSAAPVADPAATEKLVRSALTSREFAPYQAQLEKWTCTSESCVASLRFPGDQKNPGRNHVAASELMATLKEQLRPQNIGVGLTQIQQGAQGTEVGFAFIPKADTRGRFYTDEEISNIRAESIQSYRDFLEKQKNNVPKSFKS